MRMRFLPEEPITSAQKDVLKLGAFVSLIRKSIENTVCPFVFGVLGDWGTGKTSVLRMLEAQFEEALQNFTGVDGAFVPIWFNAWLYENETNVVYPLLHA